MSTWYEKAVFYHMYPLGMVGAPKQNLSVTPSHCFGELDRWIPYIKSLGFSAIYIGPLFDSSTHGYDTRDFYHIDRRLGTNEDFKAFVSCCHENGIYVVVDGVFNHTGREFPAFRDIQEKRDQSSYRDWYKGVNFGGNSPMGDSFSYETWRGVWELPCLNLGNQAVRDYLFEVIRFWVSEFDIDGIRLDCANVLDFTFMEQMRHLADTIKPEFWLMGEVIHGEYARWVNNHMLHSVTNYELHKSIYSAHNDHNYFELAHSVRRLEAVGNQLYTFTDNHDEDRIASKLHKPEHLRPVYTLLYTLPGIPSVYYGGEWGIEGRRSSTSDEALRPAVSVDEAKGYHCELTDLIKKLGEIHLHEDALHGGTYKELLLTNRQYAFSRLGSDGFIITAANNDDNPVTFSVPLPCHSSKEQAADLITGKKFQIENNQIKINLDGSDAVILKIRED